MFLQLRFHHTLLCLAITAFTLFGNHSLIAQEFIKTRKSKTKCYVIDITDGTKKQYISWDGERKNKYAHGVGTLSLKSFNTETKTWDDEKYYGKCLMKDGLFVSTKRAHFFPSFYKGELNRYGQPHGQGYQKWNKDEDAVLASFTGSFKDGKPFGAGEMLLKNGNLITGRFDNRKTVGDATIKYTDNTQYIGDTKNFLPHGKGIMISYGRDTVEGTWIHGKKNGQFILHNFSTKVPNIRVSYTDDISTELQDFEKLRYSPSVSGLQHFIQQYPETDLAKLAQIELTEKLAGFEWVRPNEIVVGENPLNNVLKDFSPANDWELQFEVTQGNASLLIYYDDRLFEATKAHKYPSSQVDTSVSYGQSKSNEANKPVQPGFYSVIKSDDELSYYRNGEYLGKITMILSKRQKCFDRMFICLGNDSDQGATVKSFSIKSRSQVSRAAIETCAFNALNKSNIPEMENYLRRFDQGIHYNDVKLAIKARSDLLVARARQRREQKELALRQEQAKRQAIIEKKKRRDEAIRNIPIGGKICFSADYVDERSWLGLSFGKTKFSMIVTAFVERKEGRRYQVRIVDVASTNDAYYESPKYNGVNLRERDIVWINPFVGEQWYVCY